VGRVEGELVCCPSYVCYAVPVGVGRWCCWLGLGLEKCEGFGYGGEGGGDYEGGGGGREGEGEGEGGVGWVWGRWTWRVGWVVVVIPWGGL